MSTNHMSLGIWETIGRFIGGVNHDLVAGQVPVRPLNGPTPHLQTSKVTLMQ